jgi:hypothetical protein
MGEVAKLGPRAVNVAKIAPTISLKFTSFGVKKLARRAKIADE